MIEYTWTAAQGTDVPDIVGMAEQHFQSEIDLIFRPEPVVYSRHMTLAVVHQRYVPNSELLYVCRDVSGRLLAYTWVKGGERAAWSDDDMVIVYMAHVAMDLSARDRIRLVTDMFKIWENFAHFCGAAVICSTTMRNDQAAFLKLHGRNGYDVRGSYCYKRIKPMSTL